MFYTNLLRKYCTNCKQPVFVLNHNVLDMFYNLISGPTYNNSDFKYLWYQWRNLPNICEKVRYMYNDELVGREASGSAAENCINVELPSTTSYCSLLVHV